MLHKRIIISIYEFQKTSSVVFVKFDVLTKHVCKISYMFKNITIFRIVLKLNDNNNKICYTILKIHIKPVSDLEK